MTKNSVIPSPSYAVREANGPLGPFHVDRRLPGPRDVLIEIDYCGVCHTDLHYVLNTWGNAVYPVVPGHEIIGHVISLGADVNDLQLGQRVGVGCLVGSCGHCDACQHGEESYCTEGLVLTYNTPVPDPGGITYGGFSKRITVDRDFVLVMPEGLDSARAAPLLCAGITTYSPMRRWKVGPGQRVGVIGLGGLGHIALEIAHAMGATTDLITHSEAKAAEAARFGAEDALISSDTDAMTRAEGQFDFILDTVPVPHRFDTYVPLLKRGGVLCIVGAFAADMTFDPTAMNMQHRIVTGSFIGGLRETQEMLDFCGAHGIEAEIELITMSEINAAMARLEAGDVKYRFVIDLSSLAES
ncbi:MAG: NAD(P)-dependent alcohol dehydrogenase [Pseudomonadota bacterium]